MAIAKRIHELDRMISPTDDGSVFNGAALPAAETTIAALYTASDATAKNVLSAFEIAHATIEMAIYLRNFELWESVETVNKGKWSVFDALDEVNQCDEMKGLLDFFERLMEFSKNSSPLQIRTFR